MAAHFQRPVSGHRRCRDAEQLFLVSFDIYRRTYSRFEKKLYLNSPEKLLKYDRWILGYDGARLVFVALYRSHKNGVKTGITASDGTRAARTALKVFHRKAFNIAGVFGEVSPPIENVLKGYVPEVPAQKAEAIIGKKITPASDGFHY